MAVLRDYDYDRHHPTMARFGGGGNDTFQMPGALWPLAALKYGNVDAQRYYSHWWSSAILFFFLFFFSSKPP